MKKGPTSDPDRDRKFSFLFRYVYTPEVYPTTSRAFGLGLCSAVARIAGIIVSYISFSNENASEAAGTDVLSLLSLSLFPSVAVPT